MTDSYRDPEDAEVIRKLSTQIELMRDFIVWLCEEKCNSSVPEIQAEFEKWEEERYN